MSALAFDRNTQQKQADLIAFGMATNVVCYSGGLVCVNAAGFAVPGKTAVGLATVGVADARADSTGLTDGAATVVVRRNRQFLLANFAGDPVAQAQVGRPCYVVDDQTVAGSNGTNTRSQAGMVAGLAASGVWVII